MPKIKIKTKLKQNEKTKTYETYGILKENTITYYEEKTKIKIEKKEDEIYFFRKNKDIELLFTFKDKKSILKVKTIDGEFIIPIVLKQKKWNKNKITLEYQIDENIKFEIFWEECL